MNKIVDVSELGASLVANTSLKELRISTNRITDIASFAKALETNTTLQTLKLNRNKITDASARQLVAPLNARAQWLALELEGNKVSAATLKLLEATQQNHPPPNPATELLADLFAEDGTLKAPQGCHLSNKKLSSLRQRDSLWLGEDQPGSTTHPGAPPAQEEGGTAPPPVPGAAPGAATAEELFAKAMASTADADASDAAPPKNAAAGAQALTQLALESRELGRPDSEAEEPDFKDSMGRWLESYEVPGEPKPQGRQGQVEAAEKAGYEVLA